MDPTAPEDFDMIPNNQLVFDDLLDKYAGAVAITEPLENWETEDLIKLIDAADRELQDRGAHCKEDDLFQAQADAAYQDYLNDMSEDDDDN